MSPPLVPAISGMIDQVFHHTIVRGCFQPRDPARTILRLASTRDKLSQLTDAQLFPVPPQAQLQMRGEGRYRGMKTQKFFWESPQLPAEEHFNLKAKSSPPCMTLFTQGERPIWILVHGWLGGSRLMDEVFWPLCDLYRTHDMALYTLPGHGPRSIPSYSLLPTFPSRNPLRNVLGLLTAVTELRQLSAALRARGYRKIGIAGTSLGVQVVALLATVEDCAERYLFDRPLVELSDPVRRLSLQDTEAFTALVEALESFYRPIRPLCRKSCVESERIDVLLAEQDHVAGRSSGERLAQHFKVDPITFPTGHVWSLGREAVIVEIMRKLRETAAPV